MKSEDFKKDLEREIEKLNITIDSGNFNLKLVKERMEEIYKEIIEMNDFLIVMNEKIKNLAKKIKNKKEDKKDFQNFVKTMHISKVDLTTYIDRGWNFLMEEQYDDAIKVLEKASSLAPDDVKTLDLLGWAYINKERYDDAMIVFQKVLQIDPENSIAKNNLGFVCFKKGIYGEAIEHLTYVLKNSKDKVALMYANFYLGLIYKEREMYDDAIKFFKNTIEIGPNHMEAYYNLGLVYFLTGREKKGITILKELIKKNKFNRWAQKAELKLKEIIGEKYEKEN